MGIPLTLIIAFWAALAAYWILSAFGSKKYVHYGSWGIGVRILIALTIAVLYQSPVTRDLLMHGELVVLNPIVQWIGVVLCACGIAFAIWARVYLGRNWGQPMSLKQDAELVTGGPYAYVRHPIYTGFLLAAAGTTLVIIWWIVPLVFLAGYFIWAAKTEEKIMLKEFPNQYPDYMKHSKMLVPFIF